MSISVVHTTLLDYIAKGAFRKYITAVEENPNAIAGLITLIVQRIGQTGFTYARANKALFTLRAKPSLRPYFDTEDLKSALDIVKREHGKHAHEMIATLEAAIKERPDTV